MDEILVLISRLVVRAAGEKSLLPSLTLDTNKRLDDGVGSKNILLSVRKISPPLPSVTLGPKPDTMNELISMLTSRLEERGSSMVVSPLPALTLDTNIRLVGGVGKLVKKSSPLPSLMLGANMRADDDGVG